MRVFVCVSVWSHTRQSSRFLSNIGGFRNRGRYCFFVLKRPNFEWYPRPFWSQKYMPDCRKSQLIFQNFLGEAPTRALALLALCSGLCPLTGPPFPKFLDPPLLAASILLLSTPAVMKATLVQWSTWQESIFVLTVGPVGFFLARWFSWERAAVWYWVAVVAGTLRQ